MTDQRGAASGRKRSSSEIRSDIRATRARLADDIDAARMKLSRRGLQDEAMGALGRVRNQASGAMSSVSDSADSQASHFGHLAVDTIKRYPVVTTLVGLGLALLAFSNGRRSKSNPTMVDDEPEMPLVKRTTAADLPPTGYR